MTMYNVYIGDPEKYLNFIGTYSGSTSEQAIREVIEDRNVERLADKFPYSLDDWPQARKGPKSGDPYTTGIRVSIVAVPVHNTTEAKVGLLGPYDEPTITDVD